MSAAVEQKVEWKTRVIRAVIFNQFDKETLVEMIRAGWQEAHSEGLRDAAEVCQRVGNQKLAVAILELDKLNRRGE